MPNLIDLLQGTNQVLPAAVRNYERRLNVLESIRISTISDVPAFSVAPSALARWAWRQVLRLSGRGNNVRLVTSTIRSAVGATQHRRPAPGAVLYEVQIAFFGLEEHETPSVNGNVGVRCSCPAYYFWCWYANHSAGCNFGTRFAPYIRKTPPPPVGLPYRNPSNIPMICKHLILLSNVLSSINFYRAP